MHMDPNADWTEDRLFFQKIAEEAGILAWIADRRGVVIYHSSAFLEFTGTNPNTTTGFSGFQLIHASDVDRTRQAFFNAIEFQQEYAVAYRLLLKDGTYQMCWGHGIPHRDAKGHFTGFFGTIQTLDAYISNVDSLAAAHHTNLARRLSARETQVLALAADGHSNEQIGSALHIAVRTVEEHVASSVRKLDATNRVHAVAKAVRLKFI